MADFDLKVIFPKFKGKKTSTSTTGTFTGDGNTLSLPAYREHLEDIFDSRVANDSRSLLEQLFVSDPDVSAAMNAYLTVANTDYRITVKDLEGEDDEEGLKQVYKIIKSMTTVTDYTLKFQRKESLKSIAEGFRYMTLLRGGISGELLFDKFLTPSGIRNVDMATIKWLEPSPGVFKPVQENPNGGDDISLDVPNFFVQYYRQNPTKVYPYSPFVSAINTISSRQQVINDLYRIMKKTGYPRIEVKVIEEVLMKNAPEPVKADPVLQRKWINQRMGDITNQINNIKADSAFVHTDSSEMKVFNEGGPRQSMDVSKIIDVLNSANQSALKTMATIIGRGESGVNTASVEARIFTLSADELNGPIADLLSQMFTFAMRTNGSESIVTVKFDKAEMRPELELETHLLIRQQRLRDDLSYGLITDAEYHEAIYNRPKPQGIEDFSGTGFMNGKSTEVDASDKSVNSDALGRSIAPKESNKQNRSN